MYMDNPSLANLYIDNFSNNIFHEIDTNSNIK